MKGQRTAERAKCFFVFTKKIAIDAESDIGVGIVGRQGRGDRVLFGSLRIPGPGAVEVAELGMRGPVL